MWEGGQPYKMDSLALSTEGRSQLGGVLKEFDSMGGRTAFVMFPEVGLVVAVTINADGNPYAAAYGIADLILSEAAAPSQS